MRSLLLVVLGCAVVAQCLPRDRFYAFGPSAGDRRLPRGDDTSSTEIPLDTAILFYENAYSSLYINVNGHISFDRALPDYSGDFEIPISEKAIIPFFADIDTRGAGNIFYREESADAELVQRATNEIKENFARFSEFQATSVFIVTWEDVGYYNEKTDKVNTFQVVIVTDGRESFACFHYTDNGINWIRSDGKDLNDPDPPAQAGFDSGDGRYFTLPASRQEEVGNINAWSNINIPGAWLFHIGNTRGDNIGVPDEKIPDAIDVHDVEAQESCSIGARTCHNNARCVDHASGYCCECNSPYYGNGKRCLEPGRPQRVSGKVSGTINGERIESVDLHSYVVTNDGRAYTAISRIPLNLGYALQTLSTVGGIIGWTFAFAPGTALNGFKITGGDFNRSATVRFRPGGEEVTVRQTVVGEDALGNIMMTTFIDGTVPAIESSAKVSIDDYKEEYRRISPGVIKAYTTRTYRVNNVAYQYSWDQTINYKECTAKASNFGSVRLAVTRNFVVFNEREQIVRYAQTSRVATQTGSDPCAEAGETCHENADCVQSGATHQCRCKQGFRGDGVRCVDVDECATGLAQCDSNARCLNTDGGYECRCEPGFNGDGRVCQREGGCNIVNNCDRNAQCVYDGSGRYACRCNPGYRGDGNRCDAETCDVRNNCDGNARCEYDASQGRYTCNCNPGYRGDGLRCVPEREETPSDCRLTRDCHVEAECILDEISRQYICKCRLGFEGDGITECRRYALSCDVVNNCDINAQCVYDRSQNTHKCQCRPGYGGDGYSCRREGGGGTDDGDYLIFAQGMSIMQMPFSPSARDRGRQTLYIPGQTAIGIDTDCYDRKFYWTDVSGRLISRANMDGTESESLVTGLSSPEGVAIDWVSKNMYWTDSGLDRIEVSRLDGTKRKTLISTGLVNPRSIVVDPARGVMFWTDWNRKAPKVETANMDGTNRRTIVDSDLSLPNGLTIDRVMQRVCWSDAGNHHIECVNYDGSGRRVIYSLASYPFALTHHGNQFYWTDWDTKSLPNINERGGQLNEALQLPLGGNGRLYGIAVARSRCPSGSNPCAYNNGGCRFLCLPTPSGGHTCTCPDDITPAECNRIALVN